MTPVTEQEWTVIKAKIDSLLGERPAAALIPRPGIYWLRATHINHAGWIDRRGSHLMHPQTLEVWGAYTWNGCTPGEWFLAEVTNERGDYDQFRSDEDAPWESSMELITHVGPRVDPPKERT